MSHRGGLCGKRGRSRGKWVWVLCVLVVALLSTVEKVQGDYTQQWRDKTNMAACGFARDEELNFYVGGSLLKGGVALPEVCTTGPQSNFFGEATLTKVAHNGSVLWTTKPAPGSGAENGIHASEGTPRSVIQKVAFVEGMLWLNYVFGMQDSNQVWHGQSTLLRVSLEDGAVLAAVNTTAYIQDMQTVEGRWLYAVGQLWSPQQFAVLIIDPRDPENMRTMPTTVGLSSATFTFDNRTGQMLVSGHNNDMYMLHINETACSLQWEAFLSTVVDHQIVNGLTANVAWSLQTRDTPCQNNQGGTTPCSQLRRWDRNTGQEITQPTLTVLGTPSALTNHYEDPDNQMWVLTSSGGLIWNRLAENTTVIDTKQLSQHVQSTIHFQGHQMTAYADTQTIMTVSDTEYDVATKWVTNSLWLGTLSEFSEVLHCPAGTERGCVACPPTLSSSSLACSLCAPGWFSNTTDMEFCQPCPADSPSLLPGSTTCVPVLTRIAPTLGPSSGDTLVDMWGHNMQPGVPVPFLHPSNSSGHADDRSMHTCTVFNPTHMRCFTPALTTPQDSVRQAGIQFATALRQGTYIPSFVFFHPTLTFMDQLAGPYTGDTTIRVVFEAGSVPTGLPEQPQAECRFSPLHGTEGEAREVNATVLDATNVVCKTPALPGAGMYDVSVSFNGEQYTTVNNTRLQVYNTTLMEIWPPLGPRTGGTEVVVLGQGVEATPYTPVVLFTPDVANSVAVQVRGTVANGSFHATTPSLTNTPPIAPGMLMEVTVQVMPNAVQNLPDAVQFRMYEDHGLGSVQPQSVPSALPWVSITLVPRTTSSFANTGSFVRVRLRSDDGVVDVTQAASWHSPSNITTEVDMVAWRASTQMHVSVALNGVQFSPEVSVFVFACNASRRAWSPTAGGATLHIHATGINGQQVTRCRVGSIVSNAQVDGSDLTCTTPPLPVGVYPLAVSVGDSPYGPCAGSHVHAYTEPVVEGVQPQSVPRGASTVITVVGTGFVDTGVAAIKLGTLEMDAVVLNGTAMRTASAATFGESATLAVTVALNGQQFTSPNGVNLRVGAACPAGTQSVEGHSGCEPCPAGTFKPYEGNQACSRCPADHYCGQGAVEANTCPTNTYSPVGSANLTQCECANGFFAVGSTAKGCEPCPHGAHCAGNHELPVADPGWWGANPYNFTRCLDPSACLGNNSCAVGANGPLCGHCQAGYYHDGVRCNECFSRSSSLLVFLLVLMVVSATALVRVLNKGGGQSSLSLCLPHLQVIALAVGTNIPLTDTLRALRGAYQTTNLSVSLLGPECADAWQWDFNTEMLLAFSTPGLIIATLWLRIVAIRIMDAVYPKDGLCGLPGRVRNSSEEHRAMFDGMLNDALFVLDFLFIPVSMHILRAFSCVDVGDGSVLVADTSVTCWTSAQHAQIVGTATVLVIFFVVGVPLLIMVIGAYGSHKSLYRSEVFERRFGSMYAQFSAGSMWFESVILARKVSVAASNVFAHQEVVFQNGLALLVVLVSSVLQLRLRPFRTHAQNRTEESLLVMSSMIILLTMMMSVPLSQGTVDTLTWLVVALLLLVALQVAWAAYDTLRSQALPSWVRSALHERQVAKLSEEALAEGDDGSDKRRLDDVGLLGKQAPLHLATVTFEWQGEVGNLWEWLECEAQLRARCMCMAEPSVQQALMLTMLHEIESMAMHNESDVEAATNIMLESFEHMVQAASDTAKKEIVVDALRMWTGLRPKHGLAAWLVSGEAVHVDLMSQVITGARERTQDGQGRGFAGK